MEVSWYISWRRSSSAGGNCDDISIQNSQVISGEGSLTCLSGCSSTISSLSYKCTAFSASEDWSFGENLVYYTFPSSGSVTIGFTGCCWISGFGSWRLSTTFSMTPRNDTNVVNSTPRAATSPVIPFQAGCNHTIKIPVSDPDNDIVNCRWATGSDCTGICGGFPGATIDSSTCTISYQANQGTGYKAAALTIEDFMPSNPSTPLSQVNLQFLVYVFTSSEPCFASPYFISPPTLQQGVCVAVEAGDTFTTQITANSNSSSAAITEISIISPSGTTKGTLTNIANTNNYKVDISWTPILAQQGQTHVLCYTAVSSSGSTSEQTCIQIDAGIPAPQPNTTALSPTNNGIVDPYNTTWSVRFDKEIKLSSISFFIKFHSALNDQVVHQIDVSSSSEVNIVESSKLRITPTYTFPEEQSFYITFEAGIVNGLEGCFPGNEAVTDNGFWSFQTDLLSISVNTSLCLSSESDHYFGSSVTATCYTTGLPAPIVYWYKDGTSLSIASNGISIVSTNNSMNITSVLTISDLKISHEGNYTCIGTNTFYNGTVSTDNASFTIITKDKDQREFTNSIK